MKWKKNECCDWCMKMLWDKDSMKFTLGHLVFCSKNCRENWEYNKGYS